jgi:hypothetical protein
MKSTCSFNLFAIRSSSLLKRQSPAPSGKLCDPIKTPGTEKI